MENLLKGFTTLVKQSEEMSIILNNLDEVFQEGGMTNLPGSTLTEILALRKIIDSMGMGMVPPKDLERFESKCQKIEIDGPAGKIPLRIIVPENEIRGGMLHIHGGGWFCGTPEMNAPQLLSWANDIGLAISSVDYRLAPENPYPAAPDDCEAVASGGSNMQKNYGIDKIIVGGESAGAHLAAVTTIRLRQRHGYKFAGSKLTYGLYDFTNWLPSREIVDGKI